MDTNSYFTIETLQSGGVGLLKNQGSNSDLITLYYWVNTIPNTNRDNYTGILTSSRSGNVSKMLTANFSGNASFRKQKAPGTLSREVDLVTGEVKRDFDINPYSYALNTSRALDADTYYTRNYADFNIKHELNSNYMDLKVNDLRVQGSLDIKPLKELKLNQ